MIYRSLQLDAAHSRSKFHPIKFMNFQRPWRDLPEIVRATIQPMLLSGYSVNHKKMPAKSSAATTTDAIEQSYPSSRGNSRLAPHASSYHVWLRHWIIDLIQSLPDLKVRSILFPSCSLIRGPSGSTQVRSKLILILRVPNIRLTHPSSSNI